MISWSGITGTYRALGPLARLAAAREAQSGETQTEQSECRRLRNECDGAEEPVRLAVDPVREVESVSVSRDTVSEAEAPKSARRIAANIDRDTPDKGSADRIEGVDLARDKAEIAD